jgi:hypothetical protein
MWKIAVLTKAMKHKNGCRAITHEKVIVVPKKIVNIVV